MNAIYDEGYEAYRAEAYRAGLANPYPASSKEAEYWAAGYCDARDEEQAGAYIDFGDEFGEGDDD